MRAMMLRETGSMGNRAGPLEMVEIADLHPAAGQLRIRVHACGVCHTDLDEIEGRLRPSALPRILGHQVVGTIDEIGSGTNPAWLGVRVGVPWLYEACGACGFCLSGRENLCSKFVGTGCDVDGGYASLMLALPEFVHPIPNGTSDAQAAPLLCAGAIGVRALRLAELSNGEPLGLMGFGASGHLVLAIARYRYPDSRISVFARSSEERMFAVQSGAHWSGDTDEQPPEPLVAIVDTTPAWEPVVRALGRLTPGGRLIVNAIRKEERDKDSLLSLDYARDLWREKVMMSVANVTRQDVRECLALAGAGVIDPVVTAYPLEGANDALRDLQRGNNRGAKVLMIEPSTR